MNGVQTRFKCKLDVKRCKRFVFPPSSLLPRSNALKTKAIRYFQTDRTLTRIVSPPLKAPAGFNVEDDSEEGYIISTPTYYITVQLLEGEGIKRSELSQELKNIASDDEVTNQTPVTTFELPQFYGAQLKGNCETEQCIYSYLLTKDGSSGFYVSITYTDKQDNTPENILKSFSLEE